MWPDNEVGIHVWFDLFEDCPIICDRSIDLLPFRFQLHGDASVNIPLEEGMDLLMQCFKWQQLLSLLTVLGFADISIENSSWTL